MLCIRAHTCEAAYPEIHVIVQSSDCGFWGSNGCGSVLDETLVELLARCGILFKDKIGSPQIEC